MASISVSDLRAALTGPDEIALIDVREEGAFSKAHIFLGSCIPLSHLEFRVPSLVPRKSVPIVVTDGGPTDAGLSKSAATRLGEIGYLDVRVLDGGVESWGAAGYEVFSGVNVPSKAFGEFVEHYYDTPRIAATDLDAMQRAGRDLVILDSRPMAEFTRMSIPGGTDCPGAELVYRIGTMARDADTLVVVNCAGRTRSIIGAQSLINAGLPNRVVALKDGTMGWELAGLTCARGETGHADAPDGEALEQARARADGVAQRFSVPETTAQEVERWRNDPDRTLFLLDVRTSREYADGHWPGATHAPGGQLVQATDEFVGVKGARIVLVDGPDGVRAKMTASWLIQLGHSDVSVLAEMPPDPASGSAKSRPALHSPFAARMTAKDFAHMQSHVTVVDLADSLTYRKGHIPGAHWAIRARMAEWAPKIEEKAVVLLTSPDGLLADFAAFELQAARPDVRVLVLEGGTNAWKDAGGEPEIERIEDLAWTAIDDVWWKPYDNTKRVREQMEGYLTWEVGLVEQVERDGLVQFRRFD